jgi:Uma2 family endonuclease
MKAFFADIPVHVLEERKQRGADRWDEMWDGILHMPPMPIRDHQDFQDDLRDWLKQFWARPRRYRVHRDVNVASIGGWPDNYRIPDLILLTPDRFHIDHNVYFEGAPTVTIEIRSPGDEAYEKLEFYGVLGVPEVWIIHRDTRVLELFTLRGEEYLREQVTRQDWLLSPATGIEFQHTLSNKLAMRIAGDSASCRELPLDE